MPKHLKPITKTNRKTLLQRTVQLVEAGRVVFTGTNNQHIWNAAEGDFKWVLSRSKAGHFCLAIYGESQPVYIRCSGGELRDDFYDLLWLIRSHEEHTLAPELLRELRKYFGDA